MSKDNRDGEVLWIYFIFGSIGFGLFLIMAVCSYFFFQNGMGQEPYRRAKRRFIRRCRKKPYHSGLTENFYNYGASSPNIGGPGQRLTFCKTFGQGVANSNFNSYDITRAASVDANAIPKLGLNNSRFGDAVIKKNVEEGLPEVKMQQI